MESGLVVNIVLIVALCVVGFFALRNTIAHFKGEGGCCDYGSVIVKKPKKLQHVIETKVISIEGMHCANCHAKVQNALNGLDGASAKVNGRKKQAVVKLEKHMDDTLIRNAVNSLGYHVSSIKTII